MDAAKLVSTTAELALDLLEKRGVVVPFCKAVSEDGSLFIYSPETNDAEDASFRRAEEHQRKKVLEEVSLRKFVGLAFSKQVTLTMSEPAEVLSAVRVEIHYVGSKSFVYLFPFRMENGKAMLLPHYTKDVEAVPLWGSTANVHRDE